jgi:ribosomal 30S subunit maturation factor RimM
LGIDIDIDGATREEVSVMQPTDLWTYRTDLPGTREGLVGCDVEARDGSIGKVDEATSDTGRAHIVVDTGPWIFGRKVIIPAGTIERIDVDDKKIFVALTKDQIKNSPEYDPAQFDEGYRTRLGTYYEPYLH